MTNPSDPHGSGPQGPNGPGGANGSGPTDYGAYQYPTGNPGPGYQGGPGASQPYTGYPGGQGEAYGAGSSGAREQFSYGGAGAWDTGEEKNTVAPWALGVSILAVVTGLTIFGALLSFIPGIIGLILGIVAVVKARRIRGPRRRMGMSITAIVLSVLAVLMTIGLIAVAVMLAGTGAMDCFTLTTPEAQQQCLEEWAQGMN